MQIVSITRNVWADQWMNRQHLTWAMKELAPVLYVQEPAAVHVSLAPRDERFLRPEVHDPAPGLRVLKLPKRLAGRTREGAWNRAMIAAKVRQIRRHLPTSQEPLVVYLWHPDQVGYFDAFPDAIRVYHQYDLLKAFHTAPQYVDNYRTLVSQADVCIGVTEEQVANLRDGAHLVPNAAPLAWYDEVREEPAAFAGIPHPRIGYVGRVSGKLDYGWLEAIADNAAWQLVLVGPTKFNSDAQRARWEALRARDNVHYLGLQPARELPAYVKALDVGLANYARGSFSEACSPLKFYEYCAAGIPCVASRIASLTGDAVASSIVHYADTGAEAVARIQAVLDGTDADASTRIRAFAEANSWRARAQQVHDLLTAAANSRRATVG